MAETHYEVLGVEPYATSEEIKRAFREKSFRWHPDKNPGQDTTPQMAALNEAHRVLSDPNRRSAYDQGLPASPLRPPPPTPPPPRRSRFHSPRILLPRQVVGAANPRQIAGIVVGLLLVGVAACGAINGVLAILEGPEPTQVVGSSPVPVATSMPAPTPPPMAWPALTSTPVLPPTSQLVASSPTLLPTADIPATIQAELTRLAPTASPIPTATPAPTPTTAPTNAPTSSPTPTPKPTKPPAGVTIAELSSSNYDRKPFLFVGCPAGNFEKHTRGQKIPFSSDGSYGRDARMVGVMSYVQGVIRPQNCYQLTISYIETIDWRFCDDDPYGGCSPDSDKFWETQIPLFRLVQVHRDWEKPF